MYEIVSAHQPNFIPYLGFFDKMKSSDIFVIRDEVLFVRKEFHNRNMIRINSNDNKGAPMSKWISVPVQDPNDYIKHVRIKNDAMQNTTPWNKQLLHQLEANYGNAQFFNEFFPDIRKIFDNSDEMLISLNMRVIEFLRKAFDIETEIVMASELGLKPSHYEKSDATMDLINICKKLGAETYLSGAGGRGYLAIGKFNDAGIKLEFQDYKHPVYKQNFPGFLPYMSAFDALFCVGGFPEPEQMLELAQ
jgi:hypothetical protein